MLAKYYDKKLIEAGCDEAGRGCLAGPVFAASVIFPSIAVTSVLILVIKPLIKFDMMLFPIK